MSLQDLHERDRHSYNVNRGILIKLIPAFADKSAKTGSPPPSNERGGVYPVPQTLKWSKIYEAL